MLSVAPPCPTDLFKPTPHPFPRRRSSVASKIDGELCSSLSLSALPDEIVLHVLSFVDPKDLGRLSSSCSSLMALAADDTLWRTLLAKKRWSSSSQASLPSGKRQRTPYKEIYRFHRQIEYNWSIGRASIAEFSPRGRARPGAAGNGLDIIDAERTIAALGADNQVQLWNYAESKLLQTLSESASPIYTLRAAPRSQRLVTSSHDVALRVYDVSGLVSGDRDDHDSKDDDDPAISGGAKLVGNLTGHSQLVWCLDIDDSDACGPSVPAYAATGSLDGQIRLFNLNNLKCEWELDKSLRGHEDKCVWSVAVDRSTASITSGHQDGSLLEVDLTTGKVRRPIPAAHAEPVKCIARHQNLVVSAGWDGVVNVFDLRTNDVRCCASLVISRSRAPVAGRTALSNSARREEIGTLQFDEEKIVVGSRHVLVVWDWRKMLKGGQAGGNGVRELMGGRGCKDLRFSKQHLIASVPDQGNVFVWDFACPQE